MRNVSEPAPERVAPSRDSRLRVAVQVWLFATALAVLTSAQQIVTMRAEGQPIPWSRALAGRIPYWYLWAALAPVVVWLARRVPIARERLASALATHVALAALISTVHATLSLIIWIAVGGDAKPTLMSAWVQWAFGLLFYNVIAYAAILGGTLAFAYHALFRERELAASRLSEQLATARLHALRMQLNPHFLFNAMNSIAMLVRKTRNDEAVRMLAGLSELLRHVLEEGQSAEVTLREELDFVRRYLAIEEVRFNDRLTVRIDADDDTLDARVPNLVLQPIVENAVRHGLARRIGAGTIEIAARRDGARVMLTVRDDGPGLASSATEAMARDATPSTGLGLANTRARLAQRFGDAAHFTLANRAEGGAEATIELPFVGDASIADDASERDSLSTTLAR